MTTINITLTLPYPPSELNPNKRLHWAQKVKIKNAQNSIGFAASFNYQELFGKDDVALSLVFFAATKRSYDLDNALASCKAMIDGLALGLNINDKQFRPIKIDRGAPDKKNPRVEVTLTTRTQK